MFSSPRSLILAIVALAALAAPPAANAQGNPGDPLARLPGAVGERGDPVAVAAYGALLDADLKPIEPTPEFLRSTLDLYIDRLTREADDRTREALERHRQALAEAFPADEMTQRFLILEFLTTSVAPQDQAYLEARNHIMRRAWYKGLLGLERFRAETDRRSNLPFDIRDFGLRNGLIRAATRAAGREYIEECRKAGVPIPPDWGSSGWSHEGDLTTNFLGFGNPAQVWRADSASPKGLCVALPRVDGANISALGIICLGVESSRACFFDASDVPVGADMPITDFLGGDDLFNGVCTDCHAGENPFVVHPASPLNMWPDNQPAAWHSPLIKPSWPQNPGPFGLLAAVPINPLPPDNDASCLECHAQGQFGRFPDVLALNSWKGGKSDYCRVILEQAVGNTMPGLGSAHDKHAQAMLAFCDQQTPPGGEVRPPDTKDNPEVVSPPIVIGPLYACVTGVEVAGGAYGAKITVSVNGTAQGSATVTTPSKTMVAVSPLVAGDVVTAVQDVDGVVSGQSNPETVIDHTVAYPSGLPTPTIDPTVIYQCGHTIAVRHVRGATVTVFTNGASPATYTSGGDWTNLPPAIRPFNLGDSYTAQQGLCTDLSGVSGPEDAGTPPSPMPVPAMDPTPPIAGQPVVGVSNLAEGALTTVSEASAGDLATFSTAVTWQPEIDVATGLGRLVQPGDSFTVVSSLCEDAKVSIDEARPCERLPAPKIAVPFVGQSFVTVTEAVPGARILVYDAALTEIGDGSGAIVGLTRPIVLGDLLTVVQRLGQCVSSSAYQTGVVCTSSKTCG